jgi:hypothetical protein
MTARHTSPRNTLVIVLIAFHAPAVSAGGFNQFVSRFWPTPTAPASPGPDAPPLEPMAQNHKSGKVDDEPNVSPNVDYDVFDYEDPAPDPSDYGNPIRPLAPPTVDPPQTTPPHGGDYHDNVESEEDVGGSASLGMRVTPEETAWVGRAKTALCGAVIIAAISAGLVMRLAGDRGTAAERITLMPRR